MFPLLALICFLLALFGGSIGSLDLITLGWVFIAAALLVGNWPMGYVTTRFRSNPPPS
jgi:hypothetical protein